MNSMNARVWFQENSANFSGQIFFDEPLSRATYYRIGGPATILAVPKSLEDLKWLAEGIAATGVRFFIVGAGSNLLVADEGFDGLVIRVNRLNLELSCQSEGPTAVRVRAGSSVMISMLLRRATEEGWGGLEFLTGVPGSIGGAVFMNAGTHLGETKDGLTKVEVVSLLEPSQGLMSYGPEELKFEYRKNLFLPKLSVIWSAEWVVQKEEPSKVKSIIDQTLARRKATQPIDFPSCGSVFKNPREHGKSAWQVIDELGLRGHQIGGAQFSEKHSNFIVNLGSAKASDVRALIELAKSRAQKELGISLHEEVIYLG